jgi:ketosteroid isomerase-like protein
MVDSAAQRILDEQQIRDAGMKYWAGFDRRDLDVYLAAFTPDATLALFGGSHVVVVNKESAQAMLAGDFEYSCHTPANEVIHVTGDSATADTLVVAQLVPRDGPVLVRGLRYIDDLVRTDSGWRIRHRQHFVLWQYDATRVEPHVPNHH